MNRALIGYTGFVGGNIHAQGEFEHLYNSKNFHDMAGQRFEEVICAGVSAVKWMANREPAEDREKIQQLQQVLATVRAKRFILISTIDVYPDYNAKDEAFDCAGGDNDAYGQHRLEFEQFCTEHFADCYVIRLPGLFGQGLKKNVIYDLMNHNCLEMINPASSFQYYDLANICADIDRAVDNGLHLVNFFTEPVKTQTIIERFFAAADLAGLGSKPSPEAHYALQTRHADQWGGEGGYIYSEAQVLEQMEKFIHATRGGQAA